MERTRDFSFESGSTEAVAGDEVAAIAFMGEERRVAAVRVERKIF